MREGERERERERETFDTLTFYCLQLTSPQDKGVRNMINFPSYTVTCKNHVDFHRERERERERET